MSATQIIRYGKSANENDYAQQKDVVAGYARPGIDRAEKFPWNRIVPPHAVKQPGRAELRTRAGTEGGDQERGVDGVKQPLSASLARYVTESRIHVRKFRAGPISVARHKPEWTTHR